MRKFLVEKVIHFTSKKRAYALMDVNASSVEEAEELVKKGLGSSIFIGSAKGFGPGVYVKGRELIEFRKGRNNVK